MRCCVSLVNDCTEFSSKVGSMFGAWGDSRETPSGDKLDIRSGRRL